MRLRVDHALPLAALALLAACGAGGARVEGTPAGPATAYGPAGDYPVVVGAPYEVGGVTYTPSDTMNFDVVGRAALGPDGAGITAAHHTLPLPSYVEVTALDTGRTILVRVERRGPMDSKAAIELSPGAAAQLGLTGQAPAAVRVRRVNPIEPERALLRTGQPAPARIETPKSLLAVLNRKLDTQEGVVQPAPQAAPTPQPAPSPAPAPAWSSKPAKVQKSAPVKATAPVPAPAPAAKPTPAPAVQGKFVVQVGAFSSQANARAAAAKAGGSVSAAGKFWRVRVGPFATEPDARAALARAKAAGYTDARIQRAD